MEAATVLVGYFLWGDTDEYRIIRSRYELEGPFRLGDRLTAMQRDMLGVMRVAGRPVSIRDLSRILAGVPRTWEDYGSHGIGIALRRVEAKGLAERTPVKRIKQTDPAFLWRIPPDIARQESLTPRRSDLDLHGVGFRTSLRARRRRPSFKREPQECTFCGTRFHALRRRLYCSDKCEGLRSGRQTPERQRLQELLAEQARELARDERSWGERPSGSSSPGFAYSLDAIWYGDGEDGVALSEVLTSRQDFTAMSELERLMMTNGSDGTRGMAKRRVKIIQGEDEIEVEAEDMAA